MKRLIMIIVVMSAFISLCTAQQYTGIEGLVQVPSAEMDSAGDVRVSVHFLNHEFTPSTPGWFYKGEKYDTGNLSLSITPFKWVSIAYTMTLFKHEADPSNPDDKDGYNQKDRFFSVKFRPLEEGRWWPAVAIGANDFLTSKPFKNNEAGDDRGNGFWRNYYVAATKHVRLHDHELGFTAVYRRYAGSYNHRWNGVVGGVTYRPAFARNWRAIVEWTGCDVNVGVDCILWRHLMLQVSLQDGRYPSGGVAYRVNLF